jgi:tripartite-type tricarboxylate transporter receptor subunit TctC
MTRIASTSRPFCTPPNQLRRRLLGACTAALACPALAEQGAVTRIVVPFSAGGAREMPARMIQNELGKELGQTWIIDNRPGAGGAMGTSQVAQAAPDGHTVLMAASSHFTTAAVSAKPGYDPVKDFVPVALIGTQSYVLIVQAAMPVRTVAELIAYAKAKPGMLNYNSAGVASSTHLAAAYFCRMAGIDLVHIPFKSTQEAANDVMGNRGHIVFVPTAGVGVYLKDPRARILAVTSLKPEATLPKVPTIADSGLPHFEFESWFGLLAPAKTPPAVVARINAAVNKVVAMPAVKERLVNLGMETSPLSPGEFNKIFLADRELMLKIVRESGITRD